MIGMWVVRGCTGSLGSWVGCVGRHILFMGSRPSVDPHVSISGTARLQHTWAAHVGSTRRRQGSYKACKRLSRRLGGVGERQVSTLISAVSHIESLVPPPYLNSSMEIFLSPSEAPIAEIELPEVKLSPPVSTASNMSHSSRY